MRAKLLLLLIPSHLGFAAIGFMLGIYLLPIMIAPPSPTNDELTHIADNALFKADVRKNLPGSDALHWGEGTLYVSSQAIALNGNLAPGPDYKLYLSQHTIETAAEFKRLKPSLQYIGNINTFNHFIVNLPEEVNPAQYNSAIVWCETFEKFITSAQYQTDLPPTSPTP